MNFKNSFHPYAMTTIFFWSLSYVFTRLALRYFSPYPLGLLRYISASAALIIVVMSKKINPPRIKDMPWFLLSGASGFFLYMLTFNKASITVNASTSSVLIATTPIMTAILARIFYKEKLNYVQYLAIAISFVGVIVLTVLRGGFSVNIGLFYLICAALCLSIYNIAQRHLTKIYSPLCSTSYSIFFGTMMLFIFLPSTIYETVGAPAIQIFYVVVLGVFSSAAAYYTWSRALSLAENVSSVSNYMFITPFLTSILAVPIAGECVESSTVIGGIFIFAGLILYTFAGKNKKISKENT